MCNLDQVQKYREAIEHYADNAGFSFNPEKITRAVDILGFDSICPHDRKRDLLELSKNNLQFNGRLAPTHILLAPARVKNLGIAG